MASLMIDFVRPCIHGLLILMTIYYYPPPVFFLMEFILKFFDVEIALIVFDAIRCYPFFFPKFAKDSDEPEGEIDIPHEVPELASSDDEDSSSESDESDDDSDELMHPL